MFELGVLDKSDQKQQIWAYLSNVLIKANGFLILEMLTESMEHGIVNSEEFFLTELGRMGELPQILDSHKMYGVENIFWEKQRRSFLCIISLSKLAKLRTSEV